MQENRNIFCFRENFASFVYSSVTFSNFLYMVSFHSSSSSSLSSVFVCSVSLYSSLLCLCVSFSYLYAYFASLASCFIRIPGMYQRELYIGHFVLYVIVSHDIHMTLCNHSSRF
uniref:Uncharacterized protein n=1 Tax=Cacopsylla melanoneura TaxID=428564 RepID=A0A8D8LGA0_9HEMI